MSQAALSGERKYQAAPSSASKLTWDTENEEDCVTLRYLVTLRDGLEDEAA